MHNSANVLLVDYEYTGDNQAEALGHHSAHPPSSPHHRDQLVTVIIFIKNIASLPSSSLTIIFTRHHNTIIINGDIGALNCCEWLLSFHCHQINNCHKKSCLQSSSCKAIITFPSPTTMTIWYLRDTIVVFVEFIQAGRLVGYPLPNLSCVAQYHSIKWETEAGPS